MTSLIALIGAAAAFVSLASYAQPQSSHSTTYPNRTLAQAPLTSAQYPNRPIRLIVPFPAGGGTDIVARTVGAKLTDAWGQQIIIDNRGGAGGTIATDTAAKAAPDGYTLLFGTPGGLVINPLLNSKLPYDPVRDFAPITLLALNPQLLAVHPTVTGEYSKGIDRARQSAPGKAELRIGRRGLAQSSRDGVIQVDDRNRDGTCGIQGRGSRGD